MSTDPYVQKACDDLAAIDRQLGELQAMRKKLADFIAIYGEPGPVPERTKPLPPTNARYVPAPAGTAKERITTAVYEILSDGQARTTRTLLTMLADRGIEPGSADKIIGLSNLLSRDGRFEADRAVGWSLKKEAPEA